VQFTSRARLVMRPTIRSLPLIGGLQMCFLDEPDISYDLEGLADIADWPGLRQKVKRGLLDEICEKCVYPNRLSISTSHKGDPETLKSFQPQGILLMRLVRAGGLPTKGDDGGMMGGLRSLVGQNEPDCFAKLKFGAESFNSSVVKNTCDPEWPEDEWSEFLLERSDGHRLFVRLYDEDTFSRDEFLGRVGIPIKDIIEAEDNLCTFPLQDDPTETNRIQAEIQGEVTVCGHWLPLVEMAEGMEVPEASEFGTSTVAVLCMFVYSCNNLVGLSEDGTMGQETPTTRVLFTCGTHKGKSDWDKEDAHPKHETGVAFRLTKEEVDSSEASIQLIDKSKTCMGQFNIVLSDLLLNPMKRQIIQIDAENKPHMTMTLSAKLLVLQQ